MEKSLSAWVAGLLAALILLTGPAISSQAEETKPAAVAGDKPAAAQPARSLDAVLDGMLAKYRAAKTYHDDGEIVINVLAPSLPGGKMSGDFDAQLDFQRPNQVRLEFQAPVLPGKEIVPRTVVSDGKKVYARSAEYDKQVVVADAPQKELAKALADLKEVGPLLTDELTGGNLVLKLLTSADLPAPLERSKAKLLEQEKFEDKVYDRVQFTTADGNVTLWIDPATSVIRRVEYPIKLPDELKQFGVTGIEMAANLKDAKLDGPIDAARFASKKAEGEHYLKQFVAPPRDEEAGAALLGQQRPDFEFANSKGEKQTAAALNGKVVVVDFWATWCGWCLKGMPNVDQVRKKYADNEKVQFLALSQDSPEVTDAQLADALKKVKVDLPWARMSPEAAQDLSTRLKFEGIPAMIVLGPDGRIQYYHVGYDEKLKEHLPPVIDELLAGKDPAANAVKVREAKQAEFKKQLEAARADAG